ncbi:MAG: transglutaminase-like domain-containing protein [bacterium]
MDKYLKETKLLDYSDSSIQKQILEKGWYELSDKEKIKQIYNFVRDDIKFGYNIADNIPSSMILKDGYGQCNTKGILFMSLLRAVSIPCRFHGFTVNKELQKGVLNGIWYILAPNEIIHSWVEVFYKNQWYNLEGFILDLDYLSSVQKDNNCDGSFCGYAIATDNLSDPKVRWNENNTYIQKEGINRDLGIYDDPDLFFSEYAQKLNCLKSFLFRNIVRHTMNKNVKLIREKNQ